MLVDLMASSWEKEREEKDRAELAIHEVFFPRYKSQMESGRTAFNNRNFDEAANCFFEAEKIAEELNSGTNKNSLGAYISYDWSEKWAAATLGRAAAAVESGDRQGAEALIARALEKQRDALLPVQSNRTEALLRVQRQQMEASEKARRDARIPSEFSKDVEDYMKKLNGYSVRIEGERLSFSNPQVVSSNCKKDAEGNWFGILAWSVQIDSDGSKWTSMRYYFIGTLGYDYDWDFSLVRMQLGDSLFELDDDMSKLVPDF
jgi:tetratricopeptide (TPR) repeat protein